MRGEIRLRPHHTGDVLPEGAARLRLNLVDGSVRILEVVTARPHQEVTLVSFPDLHDRDAVAPLVNAAVEIETSAVPALAPGELYLYELIGAEAVDEEGNVLGKVRLVADNRGQDLLTLDTPSGERLYPLAEGHLIELDREQRRVTLRKIEGLWE